VRKELATFLLLVVLCAVVSALNPRFLSASNLQNTARLIGAFGIFSLGLGLVIITGGIDLSVGSAFALLGVLLSIMLTEWHVAWPVAVLVMLGLGVLLGAAHGWLITRLGLQPFIVTLCGLLLYRGLARFIANDETKGFGNAAGFETLQRLATGSLLHVPTPFVLLVLSSVVIWVVLHRSVYGRHLFATGRNETAARYSGINTRRVVGELPIVPQPHVNRRVIAVIQPRPRPYPRQGFSQGQGRAWCSISRQLARYGLSREPASYTQSCRDRRLIRPTTVGLPAIRTDIRSCAVLACARFRRQPAQPRVGAMTVKVALEITELHVQISGGPEQRAVETLAPNRTDQAFDERRRQRHVRHRLDGVHVKDSQIRLPLVESIQRIMIRAEGGRRRLATDRSIEHLAQRDAIHDAAVGAKAHDAPRTVVHHDEHPVCMEDGRFAPKQIQTP
jgi:hypothetical protein